MAERAVDVRSGAAFLRQRWLVLLGAGVVGLGLGVLYASVVPPQLGSTALVYLQGAGGSSGDGQGEIVTQVQIVLSNPVLEKAGSSLTPRLSANKVMNSVDVEGATSQLISIQAFSSRGAQAQALAQAVAQSYVDTLQDSVRSVNGEPLAALKARDADLTQQLKSVASSIATARARADSEDPKSPAARQEMQTLDRLTADQSDLALKREAVREDLASSQPTSGASQPARIIQPAAPASGPNRLERLVVWALSGALLTAACLAGFLLIRLRRDPRLRVRDDIADAVGSSVLADLRSRPQRSVAEWIALFESYVAPPVDAWAFRQLLRALAAQDTVRARRMAGRKGTVRLEHPASITVIALAGDHRGIAVGPQLAAFAASLGISTRFVLATGHDSAASLWAACSADRSSDVRPGLQLEARAEEAAPAVAVTAGPPPERFDELLNGPSAGLPSRSGGQLLAQLDSDESREKVVSTIDAIASTIDAILGSASASASEPSRDDEDAAAHAVPARDHVDGVDHDEVDDDEVDVADRNGFHPHEVDGTDRDEQIDGVDDELAPVLPTPWEPVPRLRVVPKHGSADLTIVLVVADRGETSLQEVPATTVTTLAISPGVGTREDLARLAVAVDDTGRRIAGVVIADPDSSDRTTGRRTLDERARHPALPVRMTGISQAPLSAVERGDAR